MQNKDKELQNDIKAIFREAQKMGGWKGDRRCAVCGSPFEHGSCIECGRSVKKPLDRPLDK